MFLPPDEDPRSETGHEDERSTLTGYLHEHRLTLQMKCSGLGAEALARRSVEPSNLSLLGLVRHLAAVEQQWFRKVLAGQDVPRHFRTEDDQDAEFNGAVADPDVVAEAWETWREEVAFAERFVQEAPGMGLTVVHHGEPVTLRDVPMHMIEEYARHNGHAETSCANASTDAWASRPAGGRPAEGGVPGCTRRRTVDLDVAARSSIGA